MNLQGFYKGKKVFVTGHTGFKGSWLCHILADMGAEVTGFALNPSTDPNLFEAADIKNGMRSVIGDIRNGDALRAAFEEARPEVVFHLAAQPIVKEGYRDPVGTYGTNVMGTVKLLDCVRRSETVCSVLNVTTDKVYFENGREEGYCETDTLDGFDPYANSKSCSELVTACYKRSFLNQMNIPVSTARAGTVIGGGDFSPSRIIPDCVRAAIAGKSIILRNPYSIRPYQHVLEPLLSYLTIAYRQTEQPELAGSYNIGPDADGCVTTGELAELFCRAYGGSMRCEVQPDGGPHEAAFLKLDCSRLKETFGWQPLFSVKEAIEMTVAWTKCWNEGHDVRPVMTQQLQEALARCR